MDDAGIYICRTTDDTNAEVAVRILNGKKTDQPSQQAMTGMWCMLLIHNTPPVLFTSIYPLIIVFFKIQKYC